MLDAPKPKRKKPRYILLRGQLSGSLLVVERRWYNFTGIAKQRGRTWVIVTQSNDHTMLLTMARLTGKNVEMSKPYERIGG